MWKQIRNLKYMTAILLTAPKPKPTTHGCPDPTLIFIGYEMAT